MYETYEQIKEGYEKNHITDKQLELFLKLGKICRVQYEQLIASKNARMALPETEETEA